MSDHIDGMYVGVCGKVVMVVLHGGETDDEDHYIWLSILVSGISQSRVLLFFVHRSTHMRIRGFTLRSEYDRVQ